MKRNVSNLDRWARVALGVVLAGAGLAVGGWLALVLYLVAIVLLATAAVSFCPLYKLLGIDTCAMSKTCSQS